MNKDQPLLEHILRTLEQANDKSARQDSVISKQQLQLQEVVNWQDRFNARTKIVGKIIIGVIIVILAAMVKDYMTEHNIKGVRHEPARTTAVN